MTINTGHLNHTQLCDLLLEGWNERPDTALDGEREHVSGCLICAAELESLRVSIVNFRAASERYVEREMTQLRRMGGTRLMPMRPRRMVRPVAWAMAAALALAVALPIGLRMDRPGAAAPVAGQVPQAAQTVEATESDEALLEGINQDLSVGVPTPMQSLADPTATTNEISNTTLQRKN